MKLCHSLQVFPRNTTYLSIFKVAFVKNNTVWISAAYEFSRNSLWKLTQWLKNPTLVTLLNMLTAITVLPVPETGFWVFYLGFMLQEMPHVTSTLLFFFHLQSYLDFRFFNYWLCFLCYFFWHPEFLLGNWSNHLYPVREGHAILYLLKYNHSAKRFWKSWLFPINLCWSFVLTKTELHILLHSIVNLTNLFFSWLNTQTQLHYRKG